MILDRFVSTTSASGKLLKIKTVGRELKKRRLDTVGGQDFRWDDVDTERSEDFAPSYGKGN